MMNDMNMMAFCNCKREPMWPSDQSEKRPNSAPVYWVFK